MFKILIIVIYILQCQSQLGQDDQNYYDQYEPEVISNIDESSTSSSSSITSSNLQKYALQIDAQNCVDEHCNEEIVACKHNEDCFFSYGRYLICYNETLSYKNCKEPLLNNTLMKVVFEFEDIMECYGLCGWSKTQGLNDEYLIVFLSAYLLLF